MRFELKMDDKQEYFDYLDDLRESGETNMFGAGPYLQQEFGLGRFEARDIVLQWMRNYTPRKMHE